MRRLSFMAVICSAVLVTASCSNDSGSGDESQPDIAYQTEGLTGSEIVVGNVSSLTGPISAAAKYMAQGVEVWAAYTNANGGIDGHPVRVEIEDDKSDAATEAALFEQIAQEHDPVAFVGVGTFAPAGAQAFLEEERIPVVGGQLADPIWDQSPMFFPQGTSLNVAYYALAKLAEGKNLGVVYCAESPQCEASNDIIASAAPIAGSTVAYSQKLSLTTPNFTASCLAAKEAGVENMIVLFDEPNVLRYAQGCASQSYTPTYQWVGLLPTDETASAEGQDGALTVQTNYPWWDTSGPGETFHAAMKEFAPGQPISAATMQGWASGILFGKAATAVLEAGDEVTSETIIEALHAMKDETLDGLAGPLNFPDESPRAPQMCWFAGEVSGGKWTSPSTESQCVPEDEKAELLGAAS